MRFEIKRSDTGRYVLCNHEEGAVDRWLGLHGYNTIRQEYQERAEVMFEAGITPGWSEYFLWCKTQRWYIRGAMLRPDENDLAGWGVLVKDCHITYSDRPQDSRWATDEEIYRKLVSTYLFHHRRKDNYEHLCGEVLTDMRKMKIERLLDT